MLNSIRKCSFYLLILLLLCGLINSAPAGQILYDARAIHDIANLRFESIGTNKDNIWILIQVTAAPRSGADTLIGVSVNAETGEFVNTETGEKMSPDDTQSGVIKEGSWELLTGLNNFTEMSQGKYSWIEPERYHVSKLEAGDIYCPFASGGIVLCRYDPNAQDATRFEPAYLITRSWEKFVKPAYESFKKNSELFSGQVTQPHYDHLMELLHGENPILSVMAFRQLVKSKKADVGLIRTALGQIKDYRQAFFIYMIMVFPQYLEEGALLNELNRVIDNAKTVEEQKPVAMGIFAAKLLHPDLDIPQSLGHRLLTALQNRSVRLSSGREADRYLLEIFDLMGITPFL